MVESIYLVAAELKSGTLSEKKPVRMSIPKSEEDVNKLVQEIHSAEEVHSHEHGEHMEEQEVEADVTSLLASAVHMMSHFDGHLSDLARSIKSLDSRLQSIERLLSVLARILLLPEIKRQDLREKLLKEIIENLEA
ncbi:MAG: hypothetical protein QW543_03995 [Sulfolobales archaeon]